MQANIDLGTTIWKKTNLDVGLAVTIFFAHKIFKALNVLCINKVNNE